MDCVAALRWIAEHIAEYGGSPHRLFVGGHSAGGQIAALMALRKDWLAQGGLPMDAIKGCFCLATTHNRRMINPATRTRSRPARTTGRHSFGQPTGIGRRRDGAVLHRLGRA